LIVNCVLFLNWYKRTDQVVSLLFFQVFDFHCAFMGTKGTSKRKLKKLNHKRWGASVGAPIICTLSICCTLRAKHFLAWTLTPDEWIRSSIADSAFIVMFDHFWCLFFLHDKLYLIKIVGLKYEQFTCC